MTRLSRRGWSALIDAEAPPERLATFRILLGVFALGYLLIRFPVFVALADRPAADFDGVGVFTWSSPLPSAVVIAVVVSTVAAGFGFVSGTLYRVTGPAFAIGMLVLVSYRSSWGQLLHFEHLPVLHLLVIAWTPAVDVFAVDARRSSSSRTSGRAPEAYGWPLALCSTILVITYVIAGIAKLRYGGLDWVIGDTLRNHVAYSAARLDVLGGSPSPLAGPAMRAGWLFPFAAAGSVAIELAAPIALLGGKVRNLWVAAAWTMHVGIFALMLVGFPYPLFLVAFAPLFRLERIVARVGRQLRSVIGWAPSVNRSAGA